MKFKYIFIATAAAVFISGCEAGSYNRDSTKITLSDSGSGYEGKGVTVKGNTVTISQPGDYSLKGSLSDGQIIVSCADEVSLTLEGVNINNSKGSAIYGIDGDIRLIMAEGTENIISDGSTYELTDEDGEPDGAVFCKDSLIIEGKGSLSVSGNYMDGLSSKDSLTVNDGNITVKAQDAGLKGKDSLTVNGGKLNIDTEGNALSSSKGNMVVNGGDITVSAEGKGLKGETGLDIKGGTFNINSVDDSIHSNGSVNIDGGSFKLNTEDDGIHADGELVVNGCVMKIVKSYEGLEGETITINGGDINLTAQDDGFNASSGGNGEGNDMDNMPEGMPHEKRNENPSGTPPEGENFKPNGTPPEGEGFKPNGTPPEGENFKPNGTPPEGENTDRGNMPQNGFGGGVFDYDENCRIEINGGNIVVDTKGDGIDSNGDIYLNGGNVTVYGPENNGNGALDCGGKIYYNGGQTTALGASGMAEKPDGDVSEGYSLSLSCENYEAGAAVSIFNKTKNKELISLTSPKSFSSVVFGSEEMELNDEIEISINGEVKTSLKLTEKAVSEGDSGIGGMKQKRFGGKRGFMENSTQAES